MFPIVKSFVSTAKIKLGMLMLSLTLQTLQSLDYSGSTKYQQKKKNISLANFHHLVPPS